MSQSIKIADADLNEIKTLQDKFQKSIEKLGKIKAEQIEIDRIVGEFVEKDKLAKEEWIGLQKEEKALLDKIVKTYGTGNLNIADGTFTPTTEQQIS